MNVVAIATTALPIGGILQEFKLTDVNDKEVSFEKVKGKNGTIIVFLSTECPVAKGYNERIVKLSEDFAPQGINVIGIYSNVTETSAEVKQHSTEHFKFQTLVDKDNMLADELGAMATPASFFLDKNNKLIYKGAIDNDRKGTAITQNFLRDAVTESLSGKTVSKPETMAIGCSIQRKKN